MKARYAVMIAVAAMLAVASLASAAPEAVKQRVAITSKDLPDGTFVLSPFASGAIKRDTGTTSIVIHDPTRVLREGQSFELYVLDWTFTGKRGTLTIRERNEWLDTGDAYVAYGRWSVKGGTGQYAKVTGGGRSVGVGHDRGEGDWFARHEGYLTAR
jgi:hypothetical protein